MSNKEDKKKNKNKTEIDLEIEREKTRQLSILRDIKKIELKLKMEKKYNKHNKINMLNSDETDEEIDINLDTISMCSVID